MSRVLDEDGYPTDGAIAELTSFTGTPKGLVGLVEELWSALTTGV